MYADFFIFELDEAVVAGPAAAVGAFRGDFFAGMADTFFRIQFVEVFEAEHLLKTNDCSAGIDVGLSNRSITDGTVEIRFYVCCHNSTFIVVDNSIFAAAGALAGGAEALAGVSVALAEAGAS